MISIIIPALNEEKTIRGVINDTRLILPKAEILVVDNGSCDYTLRTSKENGAEVIRELKKGKGNAMRAGAKVAKGDILIYMDGDRSYSAIHIPDLIKPILEENKDIVYGSRFLPSSKRKMNFIRYVGNKIFS